MNEEIAEKIIYALDEYARDYNAYEYGLPTYDIHMDDMIKIVNDIITND